MTKKEMLKLKLREFHTETGKAPIMVEKLDKIEQTAMNQLEELMKKNTDVLVRLKEG